MIEAINVRNKKGLFWTLIISLLFVVLPGCKDREKIFMIGIVSSHELEKTPTWQGFSEGMTESGYAEGKKVKYIFKKIPEDDVQKFDAAVKEIQDHNPDLLFILGGHKVNQRAKEISKGNNLPVLFTAYPRSTESGLIESISHPGGNITGVQGVDTVPKGLEFLKMVIPGLKSVCVPYNPDDLASLDYLSGLNRKAPQLGVELIYQKVHSVEETVTAIKNLRKDVDAVFMIPSPTLNFRNNELSRVAIERKLPMGAGLQLDDDVLITFSVDFFDNGKRMAQLAQKIFNGAKGGDLPVETGEVKLTVNLKTAEKIGVNVPDSILAQANKIIR
jgi:putative tryptophan/tyrosine transport system substrate-binding protein